MTKAINAALVIFGVLCIGLGIQAYFFPSAGVKASIISLMAGTLLAAFSIGSLYIWTNNPRLGRILGLVAPILALCRFLPSFLKHTDKIYPAGVMTLASIVLIVMLGSGHMMANKDK